MSKKPSDKELLAGPQDSIETAYAAQPRRRAGYQRQGLGEAISKSLIRSIASSLGRILVRTMTGRRR
jgi:Bacterial protein of unknown function (DUF853)